MALKFFWRCEGTTLDWNGSTGDDFCGADNTLTLLNSATISANAARVGTNGVRCISTSAGGTSGATPSEIWPGTTTSGNTGDTVGSFAYSFRVATALDNISGIAFGLRARNAASTEEFTVRQAGTQNLLLYLDGSAGPLSISLTGNQVVADEWMGVVVRIDVPNDKARIELYNSAGTLVDSAQDLASDLSVRILSDVNTMSFTPCSGAKTNTIDWDNFIISDNYDAPLQNNLTITSRSEYSESSGAARQMRHIQSHVWG
jgi:hypothetical protein